HRGRPGGSLRGGTATSRQSRLEPDGGGQDRLPRRRMAAPVHLGQDAAGAQSRAREAHGRAGRRADTTRAGQSRRGSLGVTPIEPGPALQGRHALVTGAGRGIGAEIARALAAEGAELTLLGRSCAALDALAADLGGDARAHGVVADVTDETKVAAAFAAA